MDVLERVIVTKDKFIEETSEHLKKVTEKIDNIIIMNEEKLKALEVKIRIDIR